MKNLQSLREYENLHIVLWLLKDTCWLMLWKTGGIIMIVPTVAVAFHITWLNRKNIDQLFHNIAVSNWICANAVWMIGEFFYDDAFRPVARLFFISGLVTLAIYYFILFPKRKRLINK